MNLPKLPASLFSSYATYKEEEKKLARWIITRAEELAITSWEDQPDATPSASAPSGSSKKKGAKVPKKTDPTPKTLPTNLKAGQMAKLVAKISKLTVQKCPPEVLDLIGSVVSLRELVSGWYESLSLPSLQERCKSHAHWLDRMREVQDLLKGCPSHKLDGQLTSTRFKAESFMNLLGLDDESSTPSTSAAQNTVDEDWLPDSHKGKLKKAVPMHKRPLDEFSIPSDYDDDANDDAEVAAWFLFRDMEQMRNYIRDIWVSYGENDTTLVTASFLTTEAIEIVKEMEDEFFDAFSSLFGPKRRTYAAVIAMMFKFPSVGVSLDEITDFLTGLPDEKKDFLMVSTWVPLWKYGKTITKGFTKTPKPGYFDDFDPQVNTTSWTQEQRQREEDCLLMTHLAEVQLQVQLSGSGHTERSRGSETAEEYALVRDFRAFVDDKNHSVSFHLVFQWQIWKDHVMVNRRRLDASLAQLHEVTRNVLNAAQHWLQKGFDPQLYTENYVRTTKQMAETFLAEQLPRLVLTDTIAEWKRDNELPSTSIVPFRIFLYNPWACGVAILKILSMAHEVCTNIINGTALFPAALQLYDALLQHQKIARWPLLDRLLDIAAPTMYYAGRPAPGSFFLANNVFNGGDPFLMSGKRFPGYRYTGYGTGALPKGGPWLTRVTEKQKYRLTDADIQELFPRPEDEKQVIRYDGKTQENAQRPRFGVKRCDPFSLLRALRERVERDFEETGMGVDLFTAQMFATYVLKEWHRRTRALFIEFYGEAYIERPSQVVFLVGYLFMGLERREKAKEKYSNITEEGVMKIFDESAATMKTAREDVEKGIASGGNISYFGLKDHGAFWDELIKN